MFPQIYTSASCFYILAPSYNPLMDSYMREVGSFAITGADFRHDWGTTGSRDGSQIKPVRSGRHPDPGMDDVAQKGPGLSGPELDPDLRSACTSGTRRSRS